MPALTTERLLRARIPKKYWDASLGEVPEEDEHRKSVIAFLNNLKDAMARGVGLFLWSSENATGKTALLCIIGRVALAKSMSVLFLRSEELATTRLNDQAYDENLTMFDRASTVDVLLVDDVGKEVVGRQSTAGFREQLFEDLIRSRAQAGLVTCITSNLAPSHIKQRFQSEDLASVLRESTIGVEVKSSRKWRHEVARENRSLIEEG